MEACSSAHHWGREIMALGYDVRLMPPACVKPYVKRQKNDAADAAAICEAVTRPSMRFVTVRSIGTQAVLMHHKVREKVSDAAIARLATTVPIANTLMSIPGIGPVTASAPVASVGDPSNFSGPRQFAAFLGLVPRQLVGRQAPAWAGYQDRQCLSPEATDRGCSRSTLPPFTAYRSASLLGAKTDGDQAVQAGRGSHRQ
jgi:transposase